MFKKLKLLSIIILATSFTAGCSPTYTTSAPTSKYETNYKKTYTRSPSKYKSTRSKYKTHKTNIKTKEQMMADLRGIVSEDVYEQLEETQVKNPIKGYSNVGKTSLRKTSKVPEGKIVEKEIKKEETIAIKISKADLKDKSQEDVLKLLGDPTKAYQGKHVLLWKYSSDQCDAKLYFYENKCVSIETKKGTENHPNIDECLNSIL